MPVIMPSDVLKDNYRDISTICHRTNNPIIIKDEGKEDLAVMSVELYDFLLAKYKQISKLDPTDVYLK